MKPFVSALLATVLTATVGFSGPTTARAHERSQTTRACRTSSDRACGAQGDTKGDTNGLFDPAVEAAVSTDVVSNGHFTYTSVANVRGSARLTPQYRSVVASVVFKRPHDPAHLHTFSLLI
jgi:hypothetical protein